MPRFQQANRDVRMLESQLLSDYDSYYRPNEQRPPLPVLRVKFSDPDATWVYVDPRMNQVVRRFTRRQRLERWIYHGLHSLDFNFWYYNGAVWRATMVVLNAGGALPLAQAGIEVIGLEAGGWVSPRDMAPDELRYLRGWPAKLQKVNDEIPTHRAAATSPMTPRPERHAMMNAVGGTSIHYWGQSWRLNPWDFKVVSETRRRHGGSRIPKGSTVEDWPFDYDELEPYYDRVEREIGVSGQAGNINGTLDGRGNIFEAPRKRDYPMPPLRGSGFTELMTAAANRIGLHPFSGPAGITSQAHQGRPGCGYPGH